MAVYSYTIAAGWDNAAGLTNVESITPTGAATGWKLAFPYNPAYVVVSALGTWNIPLELTNNPSLAQNGNQTIEWRFLQMAYSSYVYMVNTYAVTSVGRITIGTTGVSGAVTYTNQNASIIQFSNPDSLAKERRGSVMWVKDAVWKLALLGVPS